MAMVEAGQEVFILKRVSASRSSGQWSDDDSTCLRRMLHQRIGVFAALPIRSLDQLSLQQRLKEIGPWRARQRRRKSRPDARASTRAFCEWLRTAFLLAAVVGSGIMAQKLSNYEAVALLCNTVPTGAILAVLILVFGPLSGAHFNPVVSIGFALRSELPWSETAIYIAAQVLGGLVGVWIAHLMFELLVWQFSITERTGPGQWLAETVATFGLLLTIFGCISRRPDSVPYAVGLYITAAYWFTASTSFANPAVTIARSLSDTFAGIASAGVAAFIVSQLAGMVVAVGLSRWLWRKRMTA